ncbi:MAG: HlyD family efflux transporter periplasmic adaptor subunit [Alphaproteobacteria bacterium]|nr:HlyD family efflux transporter periplasmic adaptor subunit [Alphaproteobacteria bacterium]
MERLKPWLWPIVLGLVLAAGLTYAFWPRPIAVDIMTLARGPMSVGVEDDGITRVKEVYVLSAPIAGRMLRIEAHAGDFIEAQKTVVATIEPVDPSFLDARARQQLQFTVSAARSARDLAAANVKGRQADLKLARQELARLRPIVAKGFASKARLDTAEATVATLDAALATAEAALRQREFEVKTAEAALIVPSADRNAHGELACCFAVRAPIDGQILRVLHESEGVVASGQPLVEVGDPANLEIVVDLLSTDAVKVAPGDAVEITRWGGDGILNGKVRRIEPFGITKVSSLGIEEQRVNVIIDITDPHEKWARLGHGYQIDAYIIRWRSDDTLLLPVGALFRTGADWTVFQVVDGRARLKVVKIGHMNDEYAEVLEGLSAGDQVISHPGETVRAGASVTRR